MLQLLKYGLVGIANTLSGYAVIFICIAYLNFSAVLGNLTGYIFGLVCSFFLNSSFTFSDTNYSLQKGLRFLLVFIIAYLCNLLTLLITLHVFGLSDLVAQLPALVVFFFVSFFLNKYFVFESSETSKNDTAIK